MLFQRTKSSRDSSSSSTQSLTFELQNCLTTFKFVDTLDFDLLQWWKEYQKYFSILAVMAKQILGTPIAHEPELRGHSSHFIY